MDENGYFLRFASTAAVAAIDRYMDAEDEDRLDDATAAVSEVLFWWGIVHDLGQTDDGSLAPPEAYRFARNCAAHRRLTTNQHDGLGSPLQYPLRYDKRLVWATTAAIQVGARDLDKPRVQAERDAYNEHLAVMEVRPEMYLLRRVLMWEVDPDAPDPHLWPGS